MRYAIYGLFSDWWGYLIAIGFCLLLVGLSVVWGIRKYGGFERFLGKFWEELRGNSGVLLDDWESWLERDERRWRE